MKNEEAKQEDVFIVEYERSTPGMMDTHSIYGAYKNNYMAYGSMYHHFYYTLTSMKENTFNFNSLYDIEILSDSMAIRSKEKPMSDYVILRVKRETLQ
jgi:hypothetical protein